MKKTDKVSVTCRVLTSSDSPWLRNFDQLAYSWNAVALPPPQTRRSLGAAGPPSFPPPGLRFLAAPNPASTERDGWPWSLGA